MLIISSNLKVTKLKISIKGAGKQNVWKLNNWITNGVDKIKEKQVQSGPNQN